MTHRGFSPQLQTAADLVAKLERDLVRVKANPHDADAAFDFLVTADHVEEWLAGGSRWPGHPKGHPSDLMRLVCHLGSGAKHFALTPGRHSAVTGVVERAGAFHAGVFQPDAFDVGGIVIDHSGLDGSLPGSIGILELAMRVVAHLRALVP